MARIVCLDFDGVIHEYSSGWIDVGVIPDPPVPGAMDWLEEFIEHYVKKGIFKLMIYSSRSKHPSGISAMKNWLLANALSPENLDFIHFVNEKPAAFVTVDDRAICFDGIFDGLSKKIIEFRTWQGK